MLLDRVLRVAGPGMRDDCLAMVPGRCPLPVLSPGQWSVTLAGAPLFEVAVDGAGQPEVGCWTRVGR